jgi:hypothetical protein
VTLLQLIHKPTIISVRLVGSWIYLTIILLMISSRSGLHRLQAAQAHAQRHTEGYNGVRCPNCHIIMIIPFIYTVLLFHHIASVKTIRFISSSFIPSLHPTSLFGDSSLHLCMNNRLMLLPVLQRLLCTLVPVNDEE